MIALNTAPSSRTHSRSQSGVEPATPDAPTPAVMLTTANVADMLACSTKTIYRLNDRGAMPRPVRLGGILRWHRPRIEQWIAEGCPSRR